jgi:hypothetical protein
VPEPAGRDDEALYEIRLQGLLDDSWSDWLDGLTIEPRACGETLLSGPIRDQAALHGLLNKIRDLGLPLLCVGRRCPGRVKWQATGRWGMNS